MFSGYAAGFGPRVFGNSNRNTTLDWATDAAGRRAWSETSGALIFVNRDEDCTPGGARDGDDSTICAADVGDITPFKIDASRTVTVGDWKPTLWIESTEAAHFRVFGTITPGASALTPTIETVTSITYRRYDLSTLTVGGGEKTLGIEALDYDKPVKLYHCITHLPTNVSAACDLVALRSGRVLLQSNNEELAKLIVGVFPGNLAMRVGMAPAMPTGSVLPYSGISDQWVQDELEIAGHLAPNTGAQVTLSLPRGRDLVVLARQTSGPNFCYENLIGIDLPAMGTLPAVPTRITVTPASPNYGGNLEVTGPIGGTGAGRMIVGTNMDTALRAELDRMAPNQTPALPLNVGWLTVGHVDEVMAVYPIGTGQDWKIAVADVKLGIELLTAAPARHALFWHCSSSSTTRSASCYGHGSVAAASARSGATPAKLSATTFSFGAALPVAKTWNYLRIYAGPGKGQVAHISKVDGKNIEVDQVWNLPTPDWVRCAAVRKPERCDFTAAGMAAPTGTTPPFWTPNIFRRDDWFVVPTSASKFVVVEATRDFNEAGSGSAATASPTTPTGLAHVPALMTAGELADATSNKKFLDKQIPAVEAILTSIVGVLGGAGTVVRVPALYFVRDDSGTLKWGDAYIPGIVNFQAMRTSSGPIVLAAKPYGPSDGGADPFETRSNTNLGITPTYVDDWSTYHIQSGEVHCGTNQIKLSARKWW